MLREYARKLRGFIESINIKGLEWNNDNIDYL